MAKKIFRLHKDTNTAESGWFKSGQITNNDLASIITNARGVATSIPSPFARIDLVKSAFKWVSNNQIDGQTSKHKLVSDALDVAQLFFLSQKYPKIKIIEWNPTERLKNLKDSKYHSELAETLDVFWSQDGSVYHFDKTERLFFILYNGKIVGGTSPSTLFFAAPDANAKGLSMDITRGGDKLLDDMYASLGKREWNFVEYMYALSKSEPFKNNYKNTGFNELDDYLNKVFRELPPSKQEIINNLNEESINKYEKCYVSKSRNNYCDIVGIQLGLQKPLKIESDFVIKSDLSDKKPLILPYDYFTKSWVFTTNDVRWDGETMRDKIPYKNESTEEKSVLPVQQDTIYWLSIGNFLEDKIIKLPYKINSSKFETAGANNYLLPLSSTFFEYFKTEDVLKYIKLEKLSKGIQVKLEIPVKNGVIHYKKIYNQEDIEHLKVHLAIMPFFKTNNIELDYTIGVLDSRINRDKSISIAGYIDGRNIEMDTPVIRRSGDQKEIKSFYYKTSESFDALRIKIDDVSGCIIPRMTSYNGNDKVSFAIDFGTTNTHIEYKEEGHTEKAFDYTKSLSLWQSLLDSSNKDPLSSKDDSIFESELMPYQINSKSEFHFPLRTAIVYNNNINFAKSLDVFKHTNNYLLYEKRFKPKSFNINTELKWSNYSKQEDKVLVEAYIEYLMLLTLYKTIILGGDPKKTNITWFYPVSMDNNELGIFSNAWKNSYKKVFKVNSIKNLNKIPESIAPFLYYRANYPGLNLSIDIGGGSSDIALFKEDKRPILISSFKFAGNAIFGDGFSGEYENNSDNNGYVNSFKEDALKAVQAINNEQKKIILDDIINSRKNSADFSSFLFSLEKESGISFNYTELLQQDRYMKLPLLIFYGAIAYYSAKLLQKSSNYEKPEDILFPDNVLFSGTASKSISILDSTDNYSNISNLYKYMFENIINIKGDKPKIALEKQPKEITCKGVLKASINEDIKSKSTVFWIGAEGDTNWAEILDKDKDIKITPKYEEIEDNNQMVGGLIAESLEEFYKLLDGYIQNINLNGSYGIDPNGYDLFKKMRSKNIKSYLKRGLDTFHKEKNNHIEETLFFYPLIGVLNTYANELSRLRNN